MIALQREVIDYPVFYNAFTVLLYNSMGNVTQAYEKMEQFTAAAKFTF